MTETKKIENVDIVRLDSLVALCREIDAVIYLMNDEKEYERARSYIDSRFSISLPYTHNAFKKEKVVNGNVTETKS